MDPNLPVWGAEAADLGLPPLRGEVSAEVCAIGLGASGLEALLAARALGLRCAGVDAGPVGAGASGRNGGFLLAGLADFHHVAAARLGDTRAAALYRLTLEELARTAEAEGLGRTGSLRIAADEAEADDCALQLDAMRSAGLAVEPYAGPEGRGLLFPLDTTFDPLTRCRRLAARVLEEGGWLYPGSPVTAIEEGTVVTAAGRVRCEHVLVAVDGRLEVLLPELAGRARTARAQMLATAPDPGVRLTRPVYYRWGYDYWQQLPDGRVALGGCRDLGGEDEWTADARPTPGIQRLLENLLRSRVGATAPVTHRWAASLGFTPDRLPVVARVRPSVVAAGGYCGTGNLIGPLSARAALALALDRPDPLLDLLAG